MDGAAATRSDAVGKAPKYLIRDCDKKYMSRFSAVAGSINEVEAHIERRKRMEFVKDSLAAYEESV